MLAGISSKVSERTTHLPGLAGTCAMPSCSPLVQGEAPQHSHQQLGRQCGPQRRQPRHGLMLLLSITSARPESKTTWV